VIHWGFRGLAQDPALRAEERCETRVMDGTFGAVEAANRVPVTESSKPSSRGGLVLPVILIISISLLTTCGLVWTSARVLNENAQATTRSLAHSMLAAESRALGNLATDYAALGGAIQTNILNPGRVWTTELFDRLSAEDQGVSTSFVVGEDREIIASFARDQSNQTPRSDELPEAFGELVRQAREHADPDSRVVTGLTMFEGTVNLVAASRIQVGLPESSRPSQVTMPVLILARPLEQEFLNAAASAYSLQGLRYFAGIPPQSYYPLPLLGVAREPIGYLAWRNAWPGDQILWRLTPSLACALLAITYILYIFFRSTDLVLEHQANLLSSLRRERELRDLKNRFVSMVSHELRTPLSTIRSAADLLDRYEGRMTPEERKRELGAIRSAVLSVTRMIEKVLSLGRSDSAEAETQNSEVDLGAFCRNLWDETSRAMDSEHRLALSGAAVDKLAYTDETFLRAALSNLFQNAIKYSPGRDQVAVEIIGKKDDCTIRVTDFGPGILLEERDAVFDAFHRGTNTGATSGTGLGLAVAKTAVERLGGRIRIVGEAAKGTTFELILPGLLKARSS